jgi:hypothetical protein
LGYQAQSVWGFRDRTEEFLYEFHHVYRPIERLIDRALVVIDQLDEDLSFWAVTRSTLGESGDEKPTGRWMSYAQARKLPGLRMTFEQFSLLHAELVELLHANDIAHPKHQRPA